MTGPKLSFEQQRSASLQKAIKDCRKDLDKAIAAASKGKRISRNQTRALRAKRMLEVLDTVRKLPTVQQQLALYLAPL